MRKRFFSMVLQILTSEHVMLHTFLIPLDYFLSAGMWPVKVAKHPYQGMTLTGHTLADLY